MQDNFEDTCRRALEATGFVIAETDLSVPEAGVFVDFVANSREEIAFYFICKGSRGRWPGCQNITTLKAAIAESYALHSHGFGPVVLLTSHLPYTGAGNALLASVSPHVLFDVLDIQMADTRLGWLAQASERQLMDDLHDRWIACLRHTTQRHSLPTFGPYPPRSRQRAAAFELPDPAASDSLADQFAYMWRDSRKYGAPSWLLPPYQVPTLPESLMSKEKQEWNRRLIDAAVSAGML